MENNSYVMDIHTLLNDVRIFYIEAVSFPDGILEAHQSLHALIPYSDKRNYFGLSRPENGKIVYKAAAEELYAGEGDKLNCKTMLIPQGEYISTIVRDYKKDIPSIEKAFHQLLNHPDLDPQGYCVEWYLNEKDVQCMIRLQK